MPGEGEGPFPTSGNGRDEGRVRRVTERAQEGSRRLASPGGAAKDWRIAAVYASFFLGVLAIAAATVVAVVYIVVG